MRTILTLFLVYIAQTAILNSQCLVVKNKTGNPIELVSVRIFDESGKAYYEGVTDTDGKIFFNKSTTQILKVSLSHVSYKAIDLMPFQMTDDCMQIVMNLSTVLLDEVWFYSDRIVPTGEIQMKRADFLQIAGSFDDPSRLLSKNQGITVVNDQNNAISFQGMPSHYNKWQINGGDVVNPNHLSNAGTSFDIYSPSAGGVNIVSGQIINNFSYKSPSSSGFESNQFSGTASIGLADSIQTYAQLSLIGLEGGGHHKIGSTDVVANLRYSFTGLLALMGVDFGGEVINYKDIVVGLSNRSKPLKWNTFFIYGDDSNTKGENMWKSNTFILSNQLEWTKENWKIQHTTNFSNKKTVLPISSRWDDATDQLFYHKTKLVNGNFGLDVLIRDQNSVSIFTLENFNRYGLVGLHPNWTQRLNDQWKVYAEIPIIYEYNGDKKLKLLQKYNISYVNDKINWSVAFSNQNIGPGGMILMDSTSNIKSKHLQSELSFPTFSKLRPSLSLFYNNISNPQFSFDEVWGDASLNLLPTDFEFMRAIAGRTYGVSGSIKPKIGKNAGMIINTTIFRAQVKNDFTIEGQGAENGFGSSTNDVNYLLSGNIYKNFQLKKGTLFVSAGFLSRGKSLRYIYTPNSTNTIVQSDFSYDEGKVYYRIDTRISYQRQKYILSLDLQNLTNRVNDFSYGLTQGWGNQLGMIPNMSYKYIF